MNGERVLSGADVGSPVGQPMRERRVDWGRGKMWTDLDPLVAGTNRVWESQGRLYVQARERSHSSSWID